MNNTFKDTAQVISYVDEKAEALKQEILNAPDIERLANKTFYLSPNGLDTNDGRTPETAWLTIDRLNDAELTWGDTVYFERGGLWRGEVVCRKGVTYAAYGTGEKPKIYGSPEDGADPAKWTLVNKERKIWKFHTELADVGLIVFNHGEFHSSKALPDYINGKYYVRNDNLIEFKTEFFIDEQLNKDLMLFSDCSNELTAQGVPAVGRKTSKGSLYLRCDKGNPGEIFSSIEFCTRPNIFSMCDNSGITVDNFCLKYCGGIAVGGYHSMNITVTNCEIGWIGGSIQFYHNNGKAVRYGNGVEVAANCYNYVVDHNWVYQNYDAGISYQAGEATINIIDYNVRFTNNLVEYCTYGIEYFLGACKNPNIRNLQDDIEFSNNIIRYSGFGFGEQRPDKKTSAAIKTWPSHANDSEDFVIKNNIFDRSRYCLINLMAFKDEWIPKYENNIIIQTENTDAYLGWYKTEDVKVRLEFDKLDVSETKRYIACLGSDIYVSQKDWLYDLQQES